MAKIMAGSALLLVMLAASPFVFLKLTNHWYIPAGLIVIVGFCVIALLPFGNKSHQRHQLK